MNEKKKEFQLTHTEVVIINGPTTVRATAFLLMAVAPLFPLKSPIKEGGSLATPPIS